MAAVLGTITVSTCGMNVAFSSADVGFRATCLYLYNLTAANTILLDITTTSGCSTGFTVPPTTFLPFTNLNGITGFSSIASSAAGSATVSYLASR